MMRRSRHLAAATFFLLLIFGVQNVSTRNVPELKGASLEPGCHHFYGKVDCQNGGRILPSAKVSVMKYDYISSDDKVSTAQVYEEGFYKLVGCVDDNGFLGNGINGNAELFLEFENVCFDGQRYYVSNPVPDKFESHLLGEEENNDIGSGIEANNKDDGKRVNVANRPMPRLQSRDFKYPPRPRPYHLRQQPAQNDLMNIDAVKKRSKRNFPCDVSSGSLWIGFGLYVTFKGSVRCYSEWYGYSKPIEGAIIKINEDDPFNDDTLVQKFIKSNGEYEIGGNAVDYRLGLQTQDAEIYLQFENVCSPGDVYVYRCPTEGVYQNIKITNGQLMKVKSFD